MIFSKLFKKQNNVKPVNVGILNPHKGIGRLEKNSPTWVFIEEYLNERIDSLRVRNDNPTLTIEKTQLLRGGIKELKKLLLLEEE